MGLIREWWCLYPSNVWVSTAGMASDEIETLLQQTNKPARIPQTFLFHKLSVTRLRKCSLICIHFLCTASWSWSYKQFWKWWWKEKRKQRKPSQAFERCRMQKLESRYCPSEVHFVLALCFQVLLSWFRFPFSVSHSSRFFPENTWNPCD